MPSDSVQAVLGQTFDRHDLLAHGCRSRQSAGAHRLPIDVYRTSTADGDPAAILRAGQAEVIAQNPEQRHLAFDIDSVGATIHGELQHSRFLLSIDPATRAEE